MPGERFEERYQPRHLCMLHACHTHTEGVPTSGGCRCGKWLRTAGWPSDGTQSRTAHTASARRQTPQAPHQLRSDACYESVCVAVRGTPGCVGLGSCSALLCTQHKNMLIQVLCLAVPPCIELSHLAVHKSACSWDKPYSWSLRPCVYHRAFSASAPVQALSCRSDI